MAVRGGFGNQRILQEWILRFRSSGKQRGGMPVFPDSEQAHCRRPCNVSAGASPFSEGCIWNSGATEACVIEWSASLGEETVDHAFRRVWIRGGYYAFVACDAVNSVPIEVTCEYGWQDTGGCGSA
ncbi:hypothetical protein XM52_18435 [Roseovarius indicus]|uniref:Uncharacterized protein n=1 Tax=Roseovarius indicus TaxID=540747 RepID=A0A0T5P5L6_9RHOB|nr:hypothetical protein XM52_18435 [Roseovarius indicus]